MADSRKRGRDIDALTISKWERYMGRPVTPIYLLFECATGYALFHAKDLYDVNQSKCGAAVDKYINSTPDPLELIAYLPFSSDSDALDQFKAVYNSNVTDKLLNFINKYSLKPNRHHSLAVTDALMGSHIVSRLLLGSRSGIMFCSIMRALREKIYQFIPVQPGQLERAQINLARLYNKQTRTKMDTKCHVVASSSSSIQGVVPHRFKGLFNVKGDEDILCTRNLVPGEALYGEKLVHIQNENRPEVEYRVWDPLRSKLAAAIHRGVTNIWIKPGSRVLYIGNVCGLTVSDLSDLVGLEGLVYVVGLSDDVVDMGGKRQNVLTIKAKDHRYHHYRMLVGMVDVMFAEIDHRYKKQFYTEGSFVVKNACSYLRAGGHYMISRQVKDMNSSSRFIFDVLDYAKEFKPIDTVMLDTYALDVGGYRMPKE